MDKLNYLKSNKQVVRDYYKVSRSFRQPTFKDRVSTPYLKTPFKHEWGILT